MDKHIILSTDPGIDDALAIIFLAKLNKLDAIWTTYGNNRLDICTSNAMKLLELMRRKEIPIIEGSVGSLSRKKAATAPVHGIDGLGNTFLSRPNRLEFNWKELSYIFSLIERFPEQVSIVSVGPLTNLVDLIQKAPRGVLCSIPEIIVMGGAVDVPGNVSPYAEFNVWSDPEAAEFVLTSGLPITLLGLDVTQQAVLSPTHVDTIAQGQTELTDFITTISRFYTKFHRNIDGFYLHDPLAAALAINPTLVETRNLSIKTETEDSERMGQTSAIYSDEYPKISVGVELHVKEFMNFFLKTILKK
jgi:purine nucleosidase